MQLCMVTCGDSLTWDTFFGLTSEALLSGNIKLKLMFITILSLINYAKDHLLQQHRNIRYGSNDNPFGFQNVIEIELTLSISIQQLAWQADIAARHIMSNRSLFDLKRFCGQYQDDWQRMLHEAFVYDRLKAIYYGINSSNMMELPEELYTFPGHILLTNLLKDGQYIYSTNDEQPFTYIVRIKYESDINKLFKEVFSVYPTLKEGLSDLPGVYSYVNTRCDTILRGLYNGKTYLSSKGSGYKSNNKKKNNNNNTENNVEVTPKGNNLAFFEMDLLNSSKISAWTAQDSNPLCNSFLSSDGKKFYYIMPTEKSSYKAMKFNESIFMSRALGFTSTQVTINGNNLYYVADRVRHADVFTKEEVHAITGMRTELVPFSKERISDYLEINNNDKIHDSDGNLIEGNYTNLRDFVNWWTADNP